MKENKRENQIDKIQSMINKKDVSRRDFFGTLGKIAILSQVVMLGASNFLASCVAFEDKEGGSGLLKTQCESTVCPSGGIGNSSGFGCAGEFTCDVSFSCLEGKTFECNPNLDFSCIDEFNCNPPTPGYGTFSTHLGGCSNC
jgi:hypothetical protein